MKKSAAGSPAKDDSFAQELDRRVAERTAELTAANEQLRKELAELKRVVESAREGALNLDLIVNSIPVPVAVTSPTGEVEALNRPTLEYFGRTFEELKGWKSSDVVHPDDLEPTVAAQLEAHTKGNAYNVESRHRRADGTYRWFNVLGLPLRDAQGHILHWFHLQIDIDDRKRAEEALLSAERNLNLTINTIPTLIQVSRPDGSVLSVNQAVLDYYGVSLQDMQKEDFRSRFYHPDDVKRLSEQRKEALKHPLHFEYEQRALGKDGKYRWFLVRYNPLLDDQGKINRWYATAFDIEDRKLAEEALRSVERNLNQILNTIPTHIYVLNTEGSVQYVNQAVMDYTGLSMEDVKQEDYRDRVIHPEDFERVRAGRAASLRQGAPFSTEQRVLGNDGHYRWFLVRYKPLLDEQRRIVRWYVAAFDIEDRKRAEEALRSVERNLDQIINTIPALAWSARPDGSAEFFNEQYLDFVGLSAEQASGWGWVSAIHPEDRESAASAWQRIMASAEPGEAEARMRGFDGKYRWFLFRASPLRDEKGQIAKWYGINTDIDDRKRAEAQRDRTIEELQGQQSMLSDSEQRFRTIFDEAGAGIALVDLRHPDARIQTNRALQTMLRHTEEELGFPHTFDELTAGENREADAATYRELCEGQRNTLRLEKHFVLQDGSSVFANVIFTLLRDAAGLPRFIVAIHEDITERRRAVERLQANRDLLALAQKSARAMSFDWYIEKEVNYWSPEQEALHGLPPGSFDGTYRSWKKTIYPPDWPLLLEAIKHAQETGEVTAEWRILWPDGSLHWLATTGQMYFDDQGKPFRLVGFTADVTRRKTIEEELRRSAAFLAQAQQLSRTGSFSWRVATNEIAWSEELYRIYEFDPGVKITLELIRTRVHPEDLTLYEKMVEQARNGADDFEWQYRLLMPDQSIKYMHAVAHATRDPSGQIEYIAAVQDVTARRQSEEAVDKARSELAHVARVMSLGALTASIAHEVNQPLSGIITNASTCMRMLDADPPNVDGARETAKRIIRDGRRAADVITRLRALFTKKDAAAELVDLNEATQEVIALSRTELERNGVITKIELKDDLPPVLGDRVQLQQVILNLLRNGSDAMSHVDDRPRELLFRTELEEGDRVRMSVQDAGIGFEPLTLDQMFQPFYTTKDYGMGIGLSVSRSIIENHRGRLWAIPNEGPGVTFSFSIPSAVDT